MVHVRDLMTIDPLTVSPETTIREAMEVLGRSHVSGAPVISGGVLAGVVTSTDLMTFAAALSGIPTERDSQPTFLEPGVEMTALEIEAEDEAAGAFFSELWENAGADVSDRFANMSSPEWNVLEEHDVSEVMTRTPLVTVSPDDTAEHAADLMRTNGIHRVLVADGAQLVGILSALDIARGVADHRFTVHEYVFGHSRRRLGG